VSTQQEYPEVDHNSSIDDKKDDADDQAAEVKPVIIEATSQPVSQFEEPNSSPEKKKEDPTHSAYLQEFEDQNIGNDIVPDNDMAVFDHQSHERVYKQAEDSAMEIHTSKSNSDITANHVEMAEYKPTSGSASSATNGEAVRGRDSFSSSEQYKDDDFDTAAPSDNANEDKSSTSEDRVVNAPLLIATINEVPLSTETSHESSSTKTIVSPLETVKSQFPNEVTPSEDKSPDENLYDEFENDDTPAAHDEDNRSIASPNDKEKALDDFENEDLVTNSVDIKPSPIELAETPLTVEIEVPSAIGSPSNNYADEYREEDFTSSPATSTPRNEDNGEKYVPMNKEEVYEEQTSDPSTGITTHSPATNEELYEDEYNDFEDDAPIDKTPIEEPKEAPHSPSPVAESTPASAPEDAYEDMDFDEDNADTLISSPSLQVAPPASLPPSAEEVDEENAYNDDDFDA
jgi:hypothetical protein